MIIKDLTSKNLRKNCLFSLYALILAVCFLTSFPKINTWNITKTAKDKAKLIGDKKFEYAIIPILRMLNPAKHHTIHAINKSVFFDTFITNLVKSHYS